MRSVFILLVFIIACSDPPPPSNNFVVGNSIPVETMASDVVDDSMPTEIPVDAMVPAPMPDQGPIEPPCEEANVVPAHLRGDIEYPVTDSSSVIQLGLGHDTRRDEMLQECVIGTIGESGAEDTVFEVHEIETREQLSEDLKIDGRIKGGFFGIGFDNRTSIARSRDINMYDLNILIQVRVKTGSRALVGDFSISEDNQASFTTSPFDFGRRCGDRFVQQITYGGELLIVLSISTTSETDRRELSNRLSASFGLWGSANFNVNRDVNRELEGREFNILIERSGGGGALPSISSPDELFAYAQRFPEEVANHPPSIFEFVTRPYDRIAEGALCLPGFDKKSIELMELAWEKVNEAIGVRNTLDDAIAFPQDYVCGINQERRVQLTLVEDFLEEAEELMEGCSAEMLDPDASITTSPSCRSLSELVGSFELPPMPLRWQTVIEASLNATSRNQAIPISSTLICPEVMIEGRWREGTANRHYWKDCPMGSFNSGQYEVVFYDPGGYSDNQGVCEYTFRCMNVEDAYLLDQCQ
jgi:hypothetical protein